MALKHGILLSVVFSAMIGVFVALLNQPLPVQEYSGNTSADVIASAVAKKTLQ